MGNAAHSHSHNSHGGGCSSCHKDDCDCDCDNVLSREIIHEHHAFEVVVCGDYEADQDDAVIRVKAGGLGESGAVIVPTITLADPNDHGSGSVTIIAQGGDVRVAGLRDENAVNINGAPSNGTRLIAGGSAVTFWRTEEEGGHGKCDCGSNYWIAECCGELAAAARAR